jgi:hypothetical protein
MKKMLSLAAVFAVLAYASPASAELKLSGDASMRMRGQFIELKTNDVGAGNTQDVNYAYRLRLKGAADLGGGYFFKTLLTTDNTLGGWNTNGSTDNTGKPNEDPKISISQIYIGRMMAESHWMVGRLPLGSMNNPIFDLTLYPLVSGITTTSALGVGDIDVATTNMDRVYGLNYGCKLGSGDVNATLVIFDNASQDQSTSVNGDGLFNDGYALHLAYKDKIGDVTIEPQAIIGLTNLSGLVYTKVTPSTIGANVTIPSGKSKIGVSGFYTSCNDTSQTNGDNVDYSGYLLRLKGETGDAMAWIDLNKTTDKTNGGNVDYSNVFVWAQYNFKMHESATGTFSLTPTVRYWAASKDNNAGTKNDFSRLRTELVATVTF